MDANDGADLKTILSINSISNHYSGLNKVRKKNITKNTAEELALNNGRKC